ncbi:hypothetical protein [Pseudoxanthomonas suwonensis]|jgi:hypothetical protein|uniref:hypothetical protein n=1 Tax=Pseudoxanthomonas suwonensis TaxID=314722 RepID=UPI00138F14E3|nr:hypothetical protein [Pseudoxanthomonas suwonensis]KAF1705740.1 hypothetical protein CSC68_00715 [Pseudoxanthomonas suwonensis]
MSKNKLAALALALPAALLAPAAIAAPFEDVSVGAGVSTLGYGLDVNASLSKHFSATLGYSTFEIDGDEDTDEVNYKGDLEFSNTRLLLNWHPLGGGFQVSVGAVVGDIKASVTGTPRAGGVYEFNGTEYTAAEVGTLKGTVELKDNVAPYAGIAYRSRGGSGLGFYVELGAVAAKTSVSLQATGLASDPRFQADLEAERLDLEDSVDVSVYPVLGAGLVYRF